jgi:membrane protease YdiL (CAAX protease family)
MAGAGVIAVTAVVVVFHVVGNLLVDSSIPSWLSILLMYTGLFGALFGISRAMVRAAGYTSIRDTLGWKVRTSDLGWGTVIWLSTLATNAVLLVIIHLAGIPVTSNVTGGSGRFHRNGPVLAAFGLAAAVGAPLFEELFFRGALLRSLRSKLGPAPAVILQGLAFGVYHVSPSFGAGNIGLAIVLSGVGVILGMAAYRWGRLGPGMIAHMIVNIMAVLAMVLLL